MFKGIVNRTIINYVLVVIGTFVVSKGWVTLDLWDIFRGAAEEAILIGLGGGGLVAIIVGAASGIIESRKDKIVQDGVRVELPKPGEPVTPAQRAEVRKAINEAKSLVE